MLSRQPSSMLYWSIVLLFVLVSKAFAADIRESIIRGWAEKLGADLWTTATLVTQRDLVAHSYSTAEVKEHDGKSLVKEIAQGIKEMMDLKVSAVRRIMDAAENTAMSHQDDVVHEYDYYNAKNITDPNLEEEEDGDDDDKVEIVLTPNRHFYGKPVNTSFSVVHVPTNVYDRAKDVLKAIKWSENLDSIFTNNYEMDPSLSWQYFASSLGFMRQYPAVKWNTRSVDLFDCRMRSWFIEAAASPKDVIILVDNSGSMTGMRREIARHVVNNILDTLGTNDFVNVYNFSDTIDEVVPCFRDVLVQANLANIRELKKGMENLWTDKIANFSAVLNRAFELLQRYREERLGSCCNQAIMLVTDGVPYNYKEIFEEYNWRDLPNMPVRVFTYLIGKEVPDVREVKWMACANRGYFVHLSTLAEVREKVLEYLPVMARPLVLWRTVHPTIWTPLYADVTIPKMTDWLWEVEEKVDQKARFQSYQNDKMKFESDEEEERRRIQMKRIVQDRVGYLKEYNFMTSVAMPVFDRRDSAKNIANLLGVAGTDVPIEDIKRLMMPHVLGVNAYAFLVTNNGYIVIHPDLRPEFHGILKPSYNSVDMIEVELVDDNEPCRYFNSTLVNFRREVIDQKNASVTLDVKYHFDEFRRVGRGKRHLFSHGIENTTFTLVIALPELYGKYFVHGIEEIHRWHANGQRASGIFSDPNWTVHPDWSYCKYHNETDPDHNFQSPEEEFLHFLNKSQKPGWYWPFKRTVSPPESVANTGPSNASSGKSEKLDKDSYFCDRKLFLSLVYDAKVTQWFSSPKSKPSRRETGKTLVQRFGVTIAFIATRSGLTRWFDYPTEGQEPIPEEDHFSKLHPRAIDEPWYKRAVDQHRIDASSFVFSLPHGIPSNSTLVTASHAIFHTNQMNQSAPVAVVGFQLQHSALDALFRNITRDCAKDSSGCFTCASEDYACYLIDDNGFVVVGHVPNEAGKFFGEIHGHVWRSLEIENVYERIRVFDYQAVCYQRVGTDSSASLSRFTPWQLIASVFQWISYRVVMLITEPFTVWADITGIQTLDDDFVLVDSPPDEVSVSESVMDSDRIEGDNEMEEEIEQGIDENDEDFARRREDDDPKKHLLTEWEFEMLLIKRSRPQPCDKEVDLWRLHPHTDKEKGPYAARFDNCKRPFVIKKVPFTNMLVVVVNTLCSSEPDDQVTLEAQEVENNCSLPCQRVSQPLVYRKRPKHCIKHHDNESKIELCGDAAQCRSSSYLLPISIAFLLIISHLRYSL